MAAVEELSDETFRGAVVQADRPVIVDFWAPWCGPCRTITPIVEELAAEHDGAIRVGKVNVDDHPALASRYGVMGLPTVMRFDAGQATRSAIGAMSKTELVKRLGL